MKESDDCDKIMKELEKTLDEWEPTPLKKVEKAPEVDKMHKTFLKELDKLKEDKGPRYWNLTSCIRNLLGLGLVYMIFKETGGWTAFFVFLILVQSEMSNHHGNWVNWMLKELVREVREVKDINHEFTMITNSLTEALAKMKNKVEKDGVS